jgi:hypothetical protein
MYINIEIYRGDDNVYITRCQEFDLYANGKTQREAIAKLKKKIAEFIRKSDSSKDAKKDIDRTAHYYYSTRSPQTH